jgi:hypothetical protein
MSLGNTLGEVAYNGYCRSSNHKSLVTGAELPAWADLKLEIKQAWVCAATAAVAGYLAGKPESIPADCRSTMTPAPAAPVEPVPQC